MRKPGGTGGEIVSSEIAPTPAWNRFQILESMPADPLISLMLKSDEREGRDDL